MWELIKKSFNILFAYKTEINKGKNPFFSKTIWANLLALIGVILAKYLEVHLTAEDIAGVLAFINIILRLISKRPVGFYEEKSKQNQITDEETSGD